MKRLFFFLFFNLSNILVGSLLPLSIDSDEVYFTEELLECRNKFSCEFSAGTLSSSFLSWNRDKYSPIHLRNLVQVDLSKGFSIQSPEAQIFPSLDKITFSSHDLPPYPQCLAPDATWSAEGKEINLSFTPDRKLKGIQIQTNVILKFKDLLLTGNQLSVTPSPLIRFDNASNFHYGVFSLERNHLKPCSLTYQNQLKIHAHNFCLFAQTQFLSFKKPKGELFVSPDPIAFSSHSGYWDSHNQTLVLTGDISVAHGLGHLEGDRLNLTYSSATSKIALEKMHISKNAKFTSKDGLQMAIADEITYLLKEDLLTLEAFPGKKVFFYDHQKEIQVSAPTVVLYHFSSPDKQIVQGEGDVRFHFNSMEKVLLQDFFKNQEIIR